MIFQGIKLLVLGIFVTLGSTWIGIEMLDVSIAPKLLWEKVLAKPCKYTQNIYSQKVFKDPQGVLMFPWPIFGIVPYTYKAPLSLFSGVLFM